MKKLLVAIAAVLVTAASYGQGQINFNNRVAAANISAPVTLPGGAGAGTEAGMKTQLFLVGAGGTKTAVGDVGTFRATPAAATGFMSQSVTVIVPGIDVGGSATVVMRAWNGATYEGSLIYGESAPVTVTLGGGTGVPADLVGLQGFVLTVVPEPSTIALGVLGAAALLLRRRK